MTLYLVNVNPTFKYHRLQMVSHSEGLGGIVTLRLLCFFFFTKTAAPIHYLTVGIYTRQAQRQREAAKDRETRQELGLKQELEVKTPLGDGRSGTKPFYQSNSGDTT